MMNTFVPRAIELPKPKEKQSLFYLYFQILLSDEYLVSFKIICNMFFMYAYLSHNTGATRSLSKDKKSSL